ncbi:hypothetical protein E2I00_011237, partial [Balaenoptera physalus]
KPNSARRFRTQFSQEQLGALKATFEKTMYPNWFIIKELSSNIHLDESIIKTWFKNQRVKRRKDQAQRNLSLEDPQQVISAKGEEMPLPGTSEDTHPMSPSISEASYHELHNPSCVEQREGAATTPRNSSCDFLPDDLQQISFRDSDPPWASTPYDMDQLIQLYVLPEDDDSSSLDRYLFPKCAS